MTRRTYRFDDDRQVQRALVRAGMHDVADPGFVRLGHDKLLLQAVRCNDAGRPRLLPRTTVTHLGPEPGLLHQAAHTVLTAALADIPQVPVDLAVAVDATAFQPELLDESGQPLVLYLSRGTRQFAPFVVAAGIPSSSRYSQRAGNRSL